MNNPLFFTCPAYPERIKFSNNYMFQRVMAHEDICKGVLEAVLGVEIECVEYHNVEQIIEPNMYSRGVRMDALVKGSNKIYDIEMQARKEPLLGKRFRYYQGAIDTSLVTKGDDYDKLLESYIIFLFVDDPFDYGLPVYTIERVCLEEPDLEINAESHWIALNASAWEQEERRPLRDLLEYVSTGNVNGDGLMEKIDSLVETVNQDSHWTDTYWAVSTIEEDLKRHYRMKERQLVREALAEGQAKGEEIGRALGEEIGMAKGLEEGLAKGLEEGLAEGRQAGIAEGRQAGLAEGREAGIVEGRQAGLAEGREAGIVEGRQAGLAEGREAGIVEGRQVGLTEGREVGLAEGQNKEKSRMAALFEKLISSGREQDALKAGTDPDYAEQLYKEFEL